MTLNTRNKFLLSLIVISVAFLILFFTVALVNFIKGNFSSIPDFERILSFNSDNFLLINNPIASILSILILIIYTPVSCYFLYIYFEKTKSPETIYLMGYFIACIFQSSKILIPLLSLWVSSSYWLILIARIEIVGRILAPVCLLFTALFSEQEQIQDADRNFGLTLSFSVFFAYILPINSQTVFSNFTISCGFDNIIYFFIFLCAIITVITFIIISKQREVSFWTSPSPYYILMFSGYIILSISDCFLFLFVGTIFLMLGTYQILYRLHKYYLWK
jgi:hypothetical protein